MGMVLKIVQVVASSSVDDVAARWLCHFQRDKIPFVVVCRIHISNVVPNRLPRTHTRISNTFAEREKKRKTTENRRRSEKEIACAKLRNIRPDIIKQCVDRINAITTHTQPTHVHTNPASLVVVMMMDSVVVVVE